MLFQKWFLKVLKMTLSGTRQSHYLAYSTWQLQKVMNRIIESVVSKYRNEFFHWDINNEILHYEKKLGPKANLRMFKKVHRKDPQVTLFLNEFNIIENCDRNINVDMYIEKFKQLKKGAIKAFGIGLQPCFHNSYSW